MDGVLGVFIFSFGRGVYSPTSLYGGLRLYLTQSTVGRRTNVDIPTLELELNANGLDCPHAVRCPHCDFGTGQRGMDRCAKCSGVGSVFIVLDILFDNTEKGYREACEFKLSKFEED